MKRKIATLFLIIPLIISSLFISVNSASTYIGDVNGDGNVTSDDARTVLRLAVGLETLSPEKQQYADADGEGGITSGDARTVLRMAVGLEELKLFISDEETVKNSFFEVHFIDVGQADCSLVICDNETLLIDGGNVADSSLVVSYLLSENISKLDYVICTHAHEDHVGGLCGPLNKFTVTNDIIAPTTGAETKCYGDFLNAVKNQGKEIFTPDDGYTFSLGSSTVEILGPITEDYSDINNTSIVSKITYGETSFLFTGDAEREAEEDILEAGYDVSATVLKVGHHGSENSTTYPFLREVMPEYAVISVGNNNDYGHPTEEALSRLTQAGAKIYRTDLHGNIVVASDGKNISITTQTNADSETSAPEVSEPSTDTSLPEVSHYIGNINSKKFHLPTCSSLPIEKNRIYFASRETAIQQEYTPCGSCNP